MPDYVNPYGGGDVQVEVDRLRAQVRRIQRDPLRYGKIKVRNDGALVFPDDSTYLDEEGLTFPDANWHKDGIKWPSSTDSEVRAQVTGTHDVEDLVALSLAAIDGSDDRVEIVLGVDRDAPTAYMSILTRTAGVDTAFKIHKGGLEFPRLTSDPPDFIWDGNMWYRSDTNTLHLRANGVTETISVGGGGMDAVYKDSDQMVSNNTTFVDDDELVLPVSANKVYFGHVQVIAGAASDTPDIKMQFTIPTGAHILWWRGWGNDPSANEASILGTDRTNNISTEALLAGVDEGMNFGITLFVAETAGNLQFQWAQQVSGGVGTYVRAGSYMMLEEGDNAG